MYNTVKRRQDIKLKKIGVNHDFLMYLLKLNDIFITSKML